MSKKHLLPSRRFFQEHAAEAIEQGYLRNDVFVKETVELNGWGSILQDTPSACYEDWGTVDPVTGKREIGTEHLTGWDKLPNLQVVRNQIGSAGQSLGLWRWDWMSERISEAPTAATTATTKGGDK